MRRLPNGRRACQGLALGERATRVLLCDCFSRSTLALGGCQASPYTHASASRIHSSSGLLLWAPLHGLGAVGAPESWYRATAVRRGIPSRLPVVLRGQSTVCVNDIAAICEWLADCGYVRDPFTSAIFGSTQRPSSSYGRATVRTMRSGLGAS